ncbi:MAG: cold shock domain-containing protein [Gemmatimonadota bacterium]|nr:cold shock domain-containing protein [Gemmatimonadota bacterium]
MVPDSGGDVVFVHYRGIAGSGYRCLTRGQHVAFELHHRPQHCDGWIVLCVT